MVDENEKYSDRNQDFDVKPFIGLITLAASLATLYMVYIQLGEFTRSRIESNWQILLNNQNGNTGKGFALEYLYNKGYNFIDIDLGCNDRSIFSFKGCEKSQIITEFQLYKKSYETPGVVRFLADGARFSSCLIQNQPIQLVGSFITYRCEMKDSVLNFSGHRNTIDGAKLTGVQIQIDGDLVIKNTQSDRIDLFPHPINEVNEEKDRINIQITESDLKNSNLRDFNEQLKYYISETNLSGSTLEIGYINPYNEVSGPEDPSEISKKMAENYHFRNDWFWDDSPPTVSFNYDDKAPLDRIPTALFVCPSAERKKTRYDDYFKVKDGTDSMGLFVLHKDGEYANEIKCEASIRSWLKRSMEPVPKNDVR
ncbi:hypothetical protein [Rhizobium rhizogenes]|uniref:hypothetical protein n=1 Tax=Rhizobium rhizogenes TaxID=359 RepID=UPI00226D44B2|nr:hypothetical protein [Rhizobium rhizogenes]